MTRTGGPGRTASRGRPEATSHAAIEQAAFELFGRHGFEGTTTEAIAQAVGVSRRTLFRYYPSKNDIPWGQFDRTLAEFRDALHAMPAQLPLHEAVHRGVLEFNRFPADARPSHRDRMRLILTTPELEAHSVHRYAAWRAVIAEFVAERTGHRPHDLLPQAAGRVSLALALTAYDVWLHDERADLIDLIDQAMSQLRDYLAN
jgi:TetR/AcrR family transcriptional regulator, regulator of mycofactocin system